VKISVSTRFERKQGQDWHAGRDSRASFAGEGFVAEGHFATPRRERVLAATLRFEAWYRSIPEIPELKRSNTFTPTSLGASSSAALPHWALDRRMARLSPRSGGSVERSC
jgi:hypothetical protein